MARGGARPGAGRPKGTGGTKKQNLERLERRSEKSIGVAVQRLKRVRAKIFDGDLMRIAGKRVEKRHVPGPLGVRGRNSDNRLIRKTLGWAPSQPLENGIKATYEWIANQVEMSRRQNGTVLPHINGKLDSAVEGTPSNTHELTCNKNLP